MARSIGVVKIEPPQSNRLTGVRPTMPGEKAPTLVKLPTPENGATLLNPTGDGDVTSAALPATCSHAAPARLNPARASRTSGRCVRFRTLGLPTLHLDTDAPPRGATGRATQSGSQGRCPHSIRATTIAAFSKQRRVATYRQGHDGIR